MPYTCSRPFMFYLKCTLFIYFAACVALSAMAHWICPIWMRRNSAASRCAQMQFRRFILALFSVPNWMLDCINRYSVSQCNQCFLWQIAFSVLFWMWKSAGAHQTKYQFFKRYGQRSLSLVRPFILMLKFMNTIICYKNPILECSI